MTIAGRQWGGLILAAAVVVALLSQHLVGIVISAILAAVSLIFLIRPPSPDLYVETTDDCLIVKVFTTRRINIRDIRSVEPHRPEYPVLLKGFLNFFLLLGNLFGGGHKLIGRDDDQDVIVRFKRWVWVWIVIPPFLIPRKNWVLMVEDPESLRQDLMHRLG
jgi:hypothetical protein